MRRLLLWGALAVAVLASATAYWLSNRQLVVERPSLGGPRPSARKHVNMVGRPAPELSGVDQHGRTIASAQFRGRVLVVNVWATWCQPCVEELPRFDRDIARRFPGQVAVVGVGQGETAADIRSFNEEKNLQFSLIEDPRSRIARRFGGEREIPRTYVVDRSGVIVHQAIGYSDKEFAAIIAAVERALRS